MKVVVPSSWSELSDFQQREIINIINEVKSKDFTEAYIKIIQILLCKNNSFWSYLRMRWILLHYPISAFDEAIRFIFDKPNIYSFPKIKGLVEPATRLGDITIEQFSICDTLLHRYSEKKEEKILRQLVACLYRFKTGFSKLRLNEIADITDKISLKEAQRIVFIFSAVRMYITDTYPDIFPKKAKEQDPLKPVFRTKEPYTPFSQVVVMMAADELRLLGNLKDCQSTLIYDFLNAFRESKRIHKLKQDAQK
ncbi:hypothetical protein MPN29_02435 [Riemerella anatipestifer]|uniref:Uncharacterized protein n=1 Tax=Riemerella anatipestifer TaxID=34085 RepID=A0A1S7DU90_RIEAN|nr:hypothetical protein [Riemerella anatipestifer]AQY22685.1 hypothetical protein AB406_1743 [Riemerella anatipestifer]MDD1549307.1 hypothetical protein [Riemerella anatipestifer]MDR7832025.1 hypothetical protein [Riemerella anatipestifer]OBP65144.1 hypothetical protein AWB84_01240 [Riemerella anatipestifer]QZO83701.1 hypothetical protein K6T40_02430 [Riemerella anatipestifer]